MTMQDTFDQELRARLRAAAPDAGTSELTETQIAQTARRRQHWRRGVVAAVAVFVAVSLGAVGLGAGWPGGGSEDSVQPAVEPTATKKTLGPALPPAPYPPVNEVDSFYGELMASLPVGSPAKVDYVAEGTLYTREGRRIDVSFVETPAMLASDAGFVVENRDEGAFWWIDRDAGAAPTLLPITESFYLAGLSMDGSRLLLDDTQGTRKLYEIPSGKLVGSQTRSGYEAVSVADGEVVAIAGDRVFLSSTRSSDGEPAALDKWQSLVWNAATNETDSLDGHRVLDVTNQTVLLGDERCVYRSEPDDTFAPRKLRCYDGEYRFPTARLSDDETRIAVGRYNVFNDNRPPGFVEFADVDIAHGTIADGVRDNAPNTVHPWVLGWEDSDTVLLKIVPEDVIGGGDIPNVVLRCVVATGKCEITPDPAIRTEPAAPYDAGISSQRLDL